MTVKESVKYKKVHGKFGIVSADPMPTSEELKNYYAEKYYQNANGTTTYESSYTEKELEHKLLEADIALQCLTEVYENTRDDISLVEFGCGEGFFLKQVNKRTKWQFIGVDFSQYGVEKWNPEILNQCQFGDVYLFLEKYKKEGKKFDVCVLRNVLEHVIDPKKLLADLREILTSTGTLLITVPNDYSKTQLLAKKLNYIDDDFWFLPPDHLYYFNSDNIKTFVQESGYKIKDIYSSFPVDFYLFHSGSNYVQNKENGKDAHFARVTLDLLLAEAGLDKILNLYRSFVECGVGRDITLALTKNE